VVSAGSPARYNQLNATQVPPALVPPSRLTFIETQMFPHHGWSDHDIECYAFVAMAYTAAGIPWPYVPGNAENFLDNLGVKANPGFAKIMNGTGAPHPGDIIVMQDGKFGHVAIVTAVHLDATDQTGTVEIAQANADKTTDTLRVSGGKVLSPWRGYTVEGFVRYTEKLG
jgi:surface antigen